MKAAVGLSASVFAVIYAAFQMSMAQFLLMCMVVPPVACVALLPFINQVPRMQKDELMPHGILSKPARFFMIYQVRWGTGRQPCSIF
jgi:Nodulin-like